MGRLIIINVMYGEEWRYMGGGTMKSASDVATCVHSSSELSLAW